MPLCCSANGSLVGAFSRWGWEISRKWIFFSCALFELFE
uniref:Uncharacterized protein n=1 Tax=Anguilla anguilla TaxID=7936 RepID=A0A0E9WJ76_ANGAN